MMTLDLRFIGTPFVVLIIMQLCSSHPSFENLTCHFNVWVTLHTICYRCVSKIIQLFFFISHNTMSHLRRLHINTLILVLAENNCFLMICLFYKSLISHNSKISRRLQLEDKDTFQNLYGVKILFFLQNIFTYGLH